jgi:uncharacterized protein YcaQ
VSGPGLPERLSLPAARRIALAAQGFARPRPTAPVDAGHLRRLIERLGLLQLDFVTVLVPSHYMVPFSRLGPYDRGRLDRLANGRAFTEQWAHEASVVPVDAWPLLAHRRAAFRCRPDGFERFLAEQPAYVERVLDEVRRRGALSAEDLPDPEAGPTGLEHSWFKSVQRAVLETFFGRGELAVPGRRGFVRRYDLAERVVPAEHYERRVEPDEAQRELLRRSARALGVGTAADLADVFRMPVGAAKPRLAELVAAGELALVQVDGWRETAYLDPAARRPRRVRATALLSPFDPLIWFRPRTARLFAFDFRFEIFVPPEKRRWGAYVLPFLLGDRLVARVDLKSDRAAGALRVLGAWREPWADPAAVAPPLAAELRTLAAWLGLADLTVADRGELAAELRAADG